MSLRKIQPNPVNTRGKNKMNGAWNNAFISLHVWDLPFFNISRTDQMTLM